MQEAVSQKQLKTSRELKGQQVLYEDKKIAILKQNLRALNMHLKQSDKIIICLFEGLYM